MTAPRLLFVCFLAISVLSLACWPAAALNPGEHADARAALKALETGQKEVAALHAARLSDPLAKKIVLWRQLIDKSADHDFAAITSFLDANPTWPRQLRLRNNAEKALPDTLSAAEVIAWFDKHPPVTGGGALSYALALKDRQQNERLTELVPSLWRARDFERQDDAQFYGTFKPWIDRETDLARLERQIAQRKATAARRQAAYLGGGYPALTDARLRLASQSPGVDAAIKRVPAGLANDTGLLYERARWRQRKGRYQGVVELLLQAPSAAEQAALWWPLREWAVRRGLDRQDYETIYRIAAAHGAEKGLIFAEGEWLAGWVALSYLQDPNRARPHFERLYQGVTSPISRARGAYWTGRAAAAAGAKGEAAQWYDRAAVYGVTFYGQLAHEELGRDLVIELRRDGQPSQAAKAAFKQQELAQVAALLGEFEAWSLQRLFINELTKDLQGADAFRVAAEFARGENRHDLSVRLAKAARRDGVDLPDQLYPLRPIVVRDDLEEALVLALIRQESSLYSRAVSRAGALGLMQLIPSTAKLVAKQEGLNYAKNRLTEDPDYNVRLGQRYLADLLVRFQGSVPLALAGYNAGPNRVARWIKQNGDPRTEQVDIIDWIERIPFAETRNYVQRISETVPVYRHRLTNPDTYIVSPAVPEATD